MAYATHAHNSALSNIWAGITGFFASVGRAIVVSSAAEERLRKVEMLNAKTDAELAAMNLRREDIATYVFRDLMYL